MVSFMLISKVFINDIHFLMHTIAYKSIIFIEQEICTFVIDQYSEIVQDQDCNNENFQGVQCVPWNIKNNNHGKVQESIAFDADIVIYNRGIIAVH